MIRAGLLALLLAGPAAADGLRGQVLCAAAWSRLADSLAPAAAVRGSVTQDGDWCAVTAPVIDLQGQYVPDWHMDRLRFRGTALGWFADGSTAPEGLELAVEGLRLVVQTGDAQMDWLFKAQSRPNRIAADAALSWDPEAKVLRLEGLTIDFPGENRIAVSGVATGVDFSSTGALQASAAGFAVTEADLAITTHGLFEWYALMLLGPMLLPPDGDMDAAFAGFQRDLTDFVGELPGTSFPDDSKAALVTLIAGLPNPAGDLTLAFRAEPGFGPQRLAGNPAQDMTDLLAGLGPLFAGVTVDVDWIRDTTP